MTRYLAWVTVTEEVELITIRYDLTGELIDGTLSDEDVARAVVRHWSMENGKYPPSFTVTAFSVLALQYEGDSMRFEKIRDMDGFRGEMWLVKDTATGEFYGVSRVFTLGRGHETMIFAANSEGEITSWINLYSGYGESHETALAKFLPDTAAQQ